MTGPAAGLAAFVRDWNPRPRVERDVITAAPVTALSAVLDADQPADEGMPLPPLWHWLHFHTWPSQSQLGADGHPADGPFLPPIPDRRRMFAGGRLHVHRPLVVGLAAERTTTLIRAVAREGSTGEMLFTCIRSEYRQRGELRVVDEQDFAYRSGENARRPHQPSPGRPPDSAAPWQASPELTSTLLFRFSALTANSHRIHYDEPYTRHVEGYPGLIVHGPLLVLLMLELTRRNRPDAVVADLDYRFRRPVFLGDGVRVTGGPAGTGAELAVATATADNATARVVFA